MGFGRRFLLAAFFEQRFLAFLWILRHPSFLLSLRIPGLERLYCTVSPEKMQWLDLQGRTNRFVVGFLSEGHNHFRSVFSVAERNVLPGFRQGTHDRRLPSGIKHYG